MARPLSQDIRERLISAVKRGSSARAAGRRFEISPAAATKLVKLERDTGSVATAQIGGYRKRLLSGEEQFLRDQIAAKPGITLKELQAALAGRGIIIRSLNTIHSMLRHLGLTHKKRASKQRSRIARTLPSVDASGAYTSQ